MPDPLCFAALYDCYNLRPMPCPPRFVPMKFLVSLATLCIDPLMSYLSDQPSPSPYSKLEKPFNGAGGGGGGGGGISDHSLGWGFSRCKVLTTKDVPNDDY